MPKRKQAERPESKVTKTRVNKREAASRSKSYVNVELAKWLISQALPSGAKSPETQPTHKRPKQVDVFGHIACNVQAIDKLLENGTTLFNQFAGFRDMLEQLLEEIQSGRADRAACTAFELGGKLREVRADFDYGWRGIHAKNAAKKGSASTKAKGEAVKKQAEAIWDNYPHLDDDARWRQVHAELLKPNRTCYSETHVRSLLKGRYTPKKKPKG